MSADAATADGEHFITDPLGCRGNGCVLDIADLHDWFLASRRHVVRFPRIPVGFATPGRTLDGDRIKLRQVSLLESSLLLSLQYYTGCP